VVFQKNMDVYGNEIAILREKHRMVHSTIIVYGGAPLGEVFAADKHMCPAIMCVVIGPLIDVVSIHLNPRGICKISKTASWYWREKTTI